jgi:hypothetical protein
MRQINVMSLNAPAHKNNQAWFLYHFNHDGEKEKLPVPFATKAGAYKHHNETLNNKKKNKVYPYKLAEVKLEEMTQEEMGAYEKSFKMAVANYLNFALTQNSYIDYLEDCFPSFFLQRKYQLNHSKSHNNNVLQDYMPITTEEQEEDLFNYSSFIVEAINLICLVPKVSEEYFLKFLGLYIRSTYNKSTDELKGDNQSAPPMFTLNLFNDAAKELNLDLALRKRLVDKMMQLHEEKEDY